MRISAIYKIQSVAFPEKEYIGSSVDIKKRWRDHLRDLKLSKHQNPKIQRHYDKYGKDDFVFIIIEPCFPEFLIIREQYYIDTLNPYFNIRRVADSNLGMKLSEETKKRMSEIHLARNYIPTQETRDKISKANKGKTAWNKGVPLGYIPKCAFKKGNPSWNKGTAKPKIPWDGIITEETRRKISESNIGKHSASREKHTPETIAKMRIAHAGHVPYTKPILQFDKDMNFIREWESGISVERTIHIDSGDISQVLTGHRKTAGGFIWKYKTER